MTIFILTLASAILLVALGELLGTRLPLLRRVALPGAVLGGLAGLLLGRQGFGLANGHETAEGVQDALEQFPALFINVVFACLMLGKRVGRLSGVWRRAQPHVVLGHVFAWGQYVVGLGITLAVLVPLFSINELAGASIAIGFQGGHGTAAGLGGNFESLDFAEGQTIAYAVATFGIVFGTVAGPLLAHALSRRHPLEEQTGNEQTGASETENDPGFSPLTGRLTMHLALIAVVIGAAWLLLQALQWAESALRAGAETRVTQYIPLFSIVLISGFATQLLLQAGGLDRYFDRKRFDALSAFGLDMVIVGALATLSLDIVGEYWPAIAILTLAGLAWNMAVFFLLGSRLFSKPWHPYALGDLGGGTATTASGLLLIRVADPKQRTHARQSYSEKQPFYEPFMGGGLVTAMALPALHGFGAWPCLLVTAAILSAWIGYAMILAKRLP